MGRFDVYRNPEPAHSADVPYLLDVQCNLLSALDSRIVVPLRRVDRFSPVGLPGNLAPVVDIEGIACFLETPKLAAVPARILKQPVASLARNSAAITGSLDFLFQGF
jgi:toxin CcdB